MGIYDYNKYLESAERRIREAEYNDDSKEIIFDFENELFIEGVSTSRVLKYLSNSHMYAQWLGDICISEATTSDIKRFLG